ncbi:MAG: TonB-dependent receptor [Niveispirillum sp.]|uniref:TonB-dependent receptor n=1 Tax=Niveispirillum sp. TaxID=1917217 RepID=UPI004035E59B
MRRTHTLCLLTTALLTQAALAEPVARTEEVIVIGTAGGREGVPLNRLPASGRSLDGAEMNRPGAVTTTEELQRRLGAVAAIDSLGNPWQQGVALRGFTAAPALGEPQGIVVYQDGMRVNEAFGDVVQWDLLPVFAIGQAQVVAGSNPAFGPNSLGGAVILSMKDGFVYQGLGGDISAGSDGFLSVTAEAGGSAGDVGYYLGLSQGRDDGWRDFSPNRLSRAYGDILYRPEAATEFGVSLTAATSELTGNGAAPGDLLSENRRGVFTHPDATDSDLLALAFRGKTEAGDGWTLRAAGYWRHLKRRTANGDQGEFEECGAGICFEEGDDLEPVIGANGSPVTGLDEEPDAVFNRTRTRTDGQGISLQARQAGALRGMGNILILGASLDHARTRYGSGTELGELDATRGVESLGIAIGNEEFNVGLKTRSWIAGASVSDTLSLTPDLHLTGALRLTHADLRLRDQLGDDLDGDHTYTALNPGVGLAWNAGAGTTLYAAVNESNRIPTPAELSCADPEKPCRFPNAFLADPPLDDVRSRTWEVGARGHLSDGAVAWSLSAFRTGNRDDIIFISAGPIVGTGYFDNVGRTWRQGVEAGLSGEAGAVSWFADYALVRASFRTPLSIQAPDNPKANEEGVIAVERGDRIPGIPLHSLKIGADVALTDGLTVGTEMQYSSSRYLRGDEANLTDPIGGFALFNLSARYQVLDGVTLHARVDNLFDRRYATFGIYGEADEMGFEDARFLSPGATRRFVGGLAARF